MLDLPGVQLGRAFSRCFFIALIMAGARIAQGDELNDLFHNKSTWSQDCMLPSVVSATSPTQELIPEIFPAVIQGTPGRNLGSEQLFAPIVAVGFPLANLGSACMAGNSSACRQFTGWIERLAAADALRFDREKHKNSQSSLVTGELSGNDTLRPIAIYTSILRRDNLIALSNRDMVFNWMRRRAIEYSHIPAGEDQSRLAQNLVLGSAVTQLAVGITTSDASLTTQASVVFRAYMDTMRSDGSFPEETRRGQSALKYENNAIALLVLTAELELARGVDLYSYRGRNGDIHKAIKFWLDSLHDQSLIADYAAANVAQTDIVQPDGKQALYFLRPQRDMTQMGWVIPYVLRFPDNDNTKSLRKMIRHGEFPVLNRYDELLGVYPQCVWGSINRR
jgi:hypothetical protein